MDDGSSTLGALGWNARLAALAESEALADARVGRVSRVDRGLVTVLTADGVERAIPAAGPVATGDWVLLQDRDDEVVVARVLPRHSAFVRGDPMEGEGRDAQVLAANLDVVFVVHALNNGPNLRRLERELVLVYDSGALPVLVCTKADLAPATDDVEQEVAAIAPGLDVVITSAVTGAGIDELRRYTGDGKTVALIGASGVGKSTLVNELIGDDVQATGDVRTGDQRGRHTTTARELIPLPGGGVLIDTPGLRAVSLWDADVGLSRAFADIEALAAQCRFSDCAHGSEPGCAVLAAVESGELDRDRLDHYLQLDQELDVAARRREARIMSRAARQFYKRR
jgi:ribosome biogenesis GTPase / thiamine phosphate phosphatase